MGLQIHLVSLPCRAAFGATTEFSTSCPTTGIGGLPQSCPVPVRGAATWVPATATSTATTPTGLTASRFAAAGIRVVCWGIRPFDHYPRRQEGAV